MSNTSLTSKVSGSMSSRGWAIALGIGAVVLAAILLVVYLDRYRARARGSIADGAGDETRTRDINLGKVALYQLSYTRACEARKIAARPERSMREFAPGDAPHTSDTTIETAQNFPK